MKAYLTNAGSAVVTQLLASQGELTITRAEVGSGIVTSEEAARERTSLIAKVADANLVSCTLSNQQAVIDVQYSNTNQTETYTIGEIGIYCEDPMNSEQEVLYCYVTFGDTPDTIVASSVSMYTRTYRVYVFVSELQSINVSVTPSGTVTPAELAAAISTLENSVNTALAQKANTPIPFTVQLLSSGWSAVEPYTQTVSASAVTANSIVQVSYEPSDRAAWIEADVYCSAQATGTLTFTCASVPSEDITANVVVIG